MSEPKPLTLVVPSGHGPPFKAGQIEETIEEEIARGPVMHISADYAFYHMDRVKQCDCRTWQLLRLVFTELPEDMPEATAAESINIYGPGVRHIAGLIEIGLKLPEKYPGIAINFQYPEQYLHPAQQLGLADLFNRMVKIVNGKDTPDA